MDLRLRQRPAQSGPLPRSLPPPRSWIARSQLTIGDATDLALLRHILLEAEHTWGTDTKTWLDFDHYKPDDLAKMLDTRNYKVVEFSWQEKRQDLLDGIATLPQPLQGEANKAIEGLKPTIPLPASSAASRMAQPSIETDHLVVEFDPQTAAIIRLGNKATGREWASKANPIALLTYQTLSQADYDVFFASYIKSKADWAFKDFGKPNIDKFGAVTQEWHPLLKDLHLEETPTSQRVLANLQIDDPEAFSSGRASFPHQLYLELILHNQRANPGSQPLLFPEARHQNARGALAHLQPGRRGSEQDWILEKSGQSISPFEVVASGNRHMHAVSESFSCKDGQHTFAVETLDAPVVALGKRTPLGFSNTQPDLSQGIHSNLYNNAWGTNYIMWYGEDMRFRYVLHL